MHCSLFHRFHAAEPHARTAACKLSRTPYAPPGSVLGAGRIVQDAHRCESRVLSGRSNEPSFGSRQGSRLQKGGDCHGYLSTVVRLRIGDCSREVTHFDLRNSNDAF